MNFNKMPWLYHATNDSAADSIMCSGFRCGSGGYAGPGVYGSLSEMSANFKSRHGSSSLIKFYVPDHAVQAAPGGDNYVVKNPGCITSIHRVR